MFSVDTGRNLNIHKMFRRRPGRLLNVVCTFHLRPVSTGLLTSPYTCSYILNDNSHNKTFFIAVLNTDF